MRFLALWTACLLLVLNTSVGQAHQLVPRGPANNPDLMKSRPSTFNCNRRVYSVAQYEPKIKKSCKRTTSWLWWLRPRKFTPPPGMHIRGDGPYFSVPLYLTDRPSKERRPRHRDRAIVNKNCDILGVVAVVPKSLNLCDRIRRVCDEKFDYYKCNSYQ